MKTTNDTNRLKHIYRKTINTISISILSLTLLTHCDMMGDKLRHIGESSRQRKTKELNQAHIKQWQRDLNFNKKQVLTLHSKIADLVATSKSQGQVSSKIARAYMKDNQFEMGAAYYNQALQGKFNKQEASKINYDKLIPLLEDALRRQTPEIDLVFDTGLCYANASRVRGWEPKRFQAAVMLFREMLNRKANEGRALYELGLLYGKAKNQFKDQALAIQYLDKLLINEDKHIPGRFARAHILVEMGQLQNARLEYQNIQVQLKSLEQEGVIKNAENTYNYKQATKNMAKLDTCLSGAPGCELAR